MQEFEIMFILKPDLTDKEIHSMLFTVRNYLTGIGGRTLKETVWGKKRMAYEIEGYEEGIYCLFVFEAMLSGLGVFDSKMKADSNVLRHMIITKNS